MEIPEPNEDLIGKIANIIGIITGIPAIIYAIVKYIIAVSNYNKIKNVVPGIYNGYWIDPIKKEVNCEILKVTKTRIWGIRAKPVYKHKASHDYTVMIKQYKSYQDIFGGTWTGLKESKYKGYALFLYNIEKQIFKGRWIGPKSSGEINSGYWEMRFYSKSGNKYINYIKNLKWNEFKEKLFAQQSILENIIARHSEFNDVCQVKNISLSLNRDSFVPTFGKISVHFADYLSEIIKENDSVLDLGTGAGFYPIFLAKNIGCHVTGIDLDHNTITLARANAADNGVSELTQFKTCEKNELFKKVNRTEKYDYIIANLPFTKISKTYKSRNELHYTSFAGSVKLLEQLILGSQYHIKPNGKLIFCYGESGYVDLLDSIVNISSWDHLHRVKIFREEDDTFYIYVLEVSETMKDFYQNINQQEQILNQ